MKYTKICCLVLFIMIFSGCQKTIIDELPDGYYIDLKTKDVDVYSDTYLKDIVKTTNINYDESVKLNTDALGEKNVEINFVVDNNTYIYHIKYNVLDLSKPKILNKNEIYVNQNSDIWLCDYIMYGDVYSNEPICRVEGDYNLNEIGDYNIKYIVTDDANNEEYFDTILHVTKPSTNKNNKKTITYFSNVYQKYKNNDTKIGIDVSEWQGDIDFNSVKKAGAEFVIIRIGLELADSKELVIDQKYKDNIKNAKDAGLEVGVYFYSTANNILEAKEQAEWVQNTLDNEELDLPIVFDWERFNKWNSLKLSFHDINEIADTFLNEVESFGYTGMLYSSKFYLENIWTNKNSYPVWLAHYTNNTNYEGNYFIWQMCNDGKINGITGDVDIDIMYLK